MLSKIFCAIGAFVVALLLVTLVIAVGGGVSFSLIHVAKLCGLYGVETVLGLMILIAASFITPLLYRECREHRKGR